MKKRFLSALLAMAMVLTMLPMSAFAADEAVVAPEVEAYGFVWDAEPYKDGAQGGKALTGGYHADSDWMGETMYVVLKDGVTADQNLWFEVTVGDDKWGCAAKTSAKRMLAFSFLNRGTQWELHPTIENEPFDYTGEHVTHATEYMKAGKVTLSVYTPATAIEGEQQTAPGAEILGDAIWTNTVTISDKGTDTMEVVPVSGTVGVANLVDQAETDPKDKLFDSYSIGKLTVANGVTTVPVIATGLEKHTNKDQTPTEGYWIGFSVVKPEGAAKVKYAFGKAATDVETLTPLEQLEQNVDGKNGEGIAFYTDADKTKTADAKTWAAVEWLKEDDTSLGKTVYHMDLSGVQLKGEQSAEYTITKATGITNGTVTLPTPATAAEGDTVEFTVKPNANFAIDAVTVTKKTEPAQGGEDTPAGQADEPINVTKGEPAADGTVTCTFTMPAYDVEVNATFKAAGTDPEEPAERTEKIASTGFEAVAADADKALGVESAPEGAAHCDPNTMWAKFEGLKADKNYKLVVTKGDAEVYTEASFPGTATKVYFTLDPELVAKKAENANDPAVVNHSVAKSAIAEGKYEFTLTEVVAQAPAGQAETEEKPLEAKAELEICKVTFAAGEGASGAADPIFAALNGKITLPEAPTNAPSADYGFAGWGVAVAEDGKYIVTKSETLTALWKNNKVVAGTEPAQVPDNFDAAAKSALEDEATVADATNLLTDKAVLDEVDVVAKTLTTDKIKELTDKVNAVDGNEGFNNVEVKVYLQVEAVSYQAASDDTAASLKVEITPMYKLVATKTVVDEQVESKVESDIPGETAKKLTAKSYNKAADIAIKLPTGFPEANLFAKHFDKDNTTVKEWIPVTVDPATKVGTFAVSAFSQFELAVNADSVIVTYKGTPDEDATYTAADINKTPLKVLENDADKGDFKGWALTADATSAKYTGTLTEKMLKDMIADKAAETKLALYPVFVKNTSTVPGGPIGGGSSGSTTYSVNVPTAEHGTVTVNPRNAAKDATVTITVAPDKGYHLESLTVTDKGGNNIELTKVDSTKYTFKMPASRVEVKATFVEGEAPAVSFTDVTEGEYYYDAVLWAVDKGITKGLTETTFGPNASCTRAQMVTFLWRAAGSPEPAATTTAFTDIDSNEYYYKAVLWAVEKGITTGATETTFAPNATVTRAQTVTFLYRYAGKPAVSGNNNFTDLEAGEYYVDAVQWAATNGITTGTTETTFSPANNCTRGQIVTFLYRHIVK